MLFSLFALSGKVYLGIMELFSKVVFSCQGGVLTINQEALHLLLSYTPGNPILNLMPWQTRTHCCEHIGADTNVSPFARARNICCRHTFCVRDTKNVSDFVQKHFVSAKNVSQFAQPKKHHGQQCVRNNVSSFTRAFTKCASKIPAQVFCIFD